MAEKIKAFCCWSGGKESALSLYKLRKSGINIFYLVNMVSVDGKRSRSHGVSSDLLTLQAEAMGVPIIQRKTTWQSYEREFKKAVLKLKKEGVEKGVFGDIDLREHRDWVKRVCNEIDIKPILPLWKLKREELLKEFIRVGFKAVVVTTQANLLSKEWLGRKIDERFITDLKALGNIDLCGEKGEYHTFVFDGPIFKNPIKFIAGGKIFKDKHWFLEIILKYGA